jgi:anti-sigma regulatory factor (Ser/Thr protein kinase)
MAIEMGRNGRKPTQTVDRASFPNEPEHASDLRSFVGVFLATAAVVEDVADEILMAVGEVVANACVHGRPRSRPGLLELMCEVHGAHIAVTVTDDGPGFDVDTVLGEHVPDLLSQGGRGFFLMRQLMDRVDVDSSARGTTVTVERDLPR